MLENWRQIIVDGIILPYEINTFGDVRRINTGKILSHKIDKKGGYHNVTLFDTSQGYNKMKLVHRLVALMFIPNPNNFPEVNHKDGNKNNNCVENLEWCTRKHNAEHAKENDLYKHGDELPHSKYSFKQIKKVCKLLTQDDLSLKEVSRKTGVAIGTIKSIKYSNGWEFISSCYDFAKQRSHNDHEEYRDKVDWEIIKGTSGKIIRKELEESGLDKQTAKALYYNRSKMIKSKKEKGYVFVTISE